MAQKPEAPLPSSEQIDAWVEAIELMHGTDVYSSEPESSDWAEYANCKSPEDVAILRSDDPSEIQLARAMCGGCEVLEPCLQFALKFETRHPVGKIILGGKTLAERQEMLGLNDKIDEPIQLPG